MRIGDDVQIPAQAFQVKDWFAERPTRAIVDEIREFIRGGNAPYEWRGHTHTKPPKGTDIVYIGDFDLDRNRACPCPCCSPNHAKYFVRGMVAWFPSEKVIRMVGPKCFATLNPEGHETAMADWEIERKRQQDADFLLANLGVAEDLKKVLEDAQPTIEAIDMVRNIVSDGRLDKILNADVEIHMGDGVLRVTAEREETYIDRDGKTGSRTIHLSEEFGTIDGAFMLSPNARRLASQLKSALTTVSQIPTPTKESIREAVERMDDTERSQTAKRLSIALAVSRELWQSAQEAQRFFSPNNIAIINGWGNHPGSPFAIAMQRDGRNVTIGRSKDTGPVLQLPESFDRILVDLPKIGTPK